MSEHIKIKHLEQFSSSEGYWYGVECNAIAKDILEKTKAKFMLEIGFNIGYSAAMWLSNGIESLRIIDINNHPDTLPAIEATIAAYPEKDIGFWLMDSKSSDAYELDISEADIAFVDGEHTYSALMSDTDLCLKNKVDWIVYDDVHEYETHNLYSAIKQLEAHKKIKIVAKYPMTWYNGGFVYLTKVL